MTLPFRLLAVADRAPFASDEAWLARLMEIAAVPGLWLQLRTKTLPPEHRARLLASAARRLGAARARTLVNGSIIEARELGLAGAHYPETALPDRLGAHAGLLAGASVHSPQARQAAERAGADYVIAGPVFAPSSKPGEGRGLAWLAEIARGSAVPLVAIGGISPARVGDCLAAGAAAVAVIGGIVLADDPRAAAAAYLAALA
nr:K152 [uncultured bacterium]